MLSIFSGKTKIIFKSLYLNKWLSNYASQIKIILTRLKYHITCIILIISLIMIIILKFLIK